METLLFLVPVIGCLVIALGRVASIRPAEVTGTPTGEVSLSFVERMRYHRGAVYSIGGLMLLGAVFGYTSAGIEMLIAGAMLAIVQVPIRYKFTTQGVALGRLHLVRHLIDEGRLAWLAPPREQAATHAYWLVHATEAPRADVCAVAQWIEREVALSGELPA